MILWRQSLSNVLGLKYVSGFSIRQPLKGLEGWLESYLQLFMHLFQHSD
jgi:hypothetical protein